MELLFTIHDILGPDIEKGLIVILNLILIESLLSVDNAAVLATMVMDLPEKDRGRALKYGIIGAYVFRGICLLLAGLLIKLTWLKIVGGLYLLYLAYDYFKSSKTKETEDDTLNKGESKFYKYTLGLLGPFWATVAMVEVMDLAFSIDNVLAAVAYTKNIYLIYIGVFIGILAMRFVAQFFVKLMERFPFLGTAAFVVIAVLGVKLVVSGFAHYFAPKEVSEVIDGEHTDTYISIATVLIFVVPIITATFFGFPKKKEIQEEAPKEKV